VYVAVCPAVIVSVVMAPPLKLKSGPVPASATICGVPTALSVTKIAAVRAPLPVGVKVTLIWQAAPAAREEPQLLVCANSSRFVPVIAIVEIVRDSVPLLVSCTLCGALLVPIACCAKVREVGARAVAGAETVKVSALCWDSAPEVPTTPNEKTPPGVELVVAIVRAEVPEAAAIDAGEKLQVAPDGKPVQDNATLPLNPATGLRITVAAAELPGVTALGENAVAETRKLAGAGPLVLSNVAIPLIFVNSRQVSRLD
jgi:hypothetical protein